MRWNGSKYGPFERDVPEDPIPATSIHMTNAKDEQMSHSDEKRRHPRVAKRIRVRSRFEGAVELETVDLSIGGLSCTAPMSLPLMTRLALSLNLPDNGGSDSEQVIEGEAVVVRSEPAEPSQDAGYRIALFFSRMEENHRQTLVEYLNRQNP